MKILKSNTSTKQQHKQAQTATEYMLLLLIVVIFVLTGYKIYLPEIYNYANIYFNGVTSGILGPSNPCGDGICAGAPVENCATCPPDCGICP